jgi:hypothetical protein
MSRRLSLATTPFLLLSMGCGSDDSAPPEEPEVIINAPKPQNGVQIVSPKFTVEAGSEVFLCMRLPYEIKETLHVQSSVAYQAHGGHHSMLYYLPADFSAEETPHECQGDEMGRGGLRFVGVGTADGGGIELPPGITLEIPAGTKLFTQSHYLNTTTKPIVGQDAINLELIDASEVVEKAGAFTQVDLGFEIPAGEPLTRTVECTSPVEAKVPFMLPHMHEFGTHISVDLVRSDGTTQAIYSSDWDVALRDDFPIVDFTEHLQLVPTDKLITSCTWNNTGSVPLLFPREMCATFMIFYPSVDGAMLACDETGRHFRP